RERRRARRDASGETVRSDLPQGVIGLVEEVDRLLDRPSGPGEALLVDRALVTAGVDRFAEPDDGQVGQLLRNRLEASLDVVELTGHGCRVCHPRPEARTRRPTNLLQLSSSPTPTATTSGRWSGSVRAGVSGV